VRLGKLKETEKVCLDDVVSSSIFYEGFPKIVETISATFNMYIIIAFPPIFFYSIDYTRGTEVKISIT
jgi:hypothetical protein